MMRRAIVVAALLAAALYVAAEPPAPAVGCPCDHSDESTLEPRVCSLCGTAEEQVDDVYFLKDINPRKPNRYLALPRAHDSGLQWAGDLPADERERLWTRAIERAQELFGDRWGLAENSHFFRTQCHAHIHIGPLHPDVEDVGGALYDHPRDFPALPSHRGVWIHPRDGRYCLHLDRDLAEIVLVR